MMIVEWIGAIAAAIGAAAVINKMLREFYQERRVEERESVASHFRRMANCLTEMVKAFQAGEIPRAAGHEYETLVGQVAKHLDASGFGKSGELLTTRNEFIVKLRRAASAALHLDYVKDITNDQREELIANLSRLEGDLQGIAEMLSPSKPNR